MICGAVTGEASCKGVAGVAGIEAFLAGAVVLEVVFNAAADVGGHVGVELAEEGGVAGLAGGGVQTGEAVIQAGLA